MIEVSETVMGDVPAERAVVRVTMSGCRFFHDDEPGRRAEEVSQLAHALAAYDLPLEVRSAQLEVDTGLFSRSSTARYELAIRCPADRVPEVLDVVSGAERARVDGIDWEHDPAPHVAGWLREAVERASARAAVLADALGVTLGPAARVTQTEVGDRRSAPDVAPAGIGALSVRRRGVADALGGLEIAPVARLGVRVEIRYGIAAVR